MQNRVAANAAPFLRASAAPVAAYSALTSALPTGSLIASRAVLLHNRSVFPTVQVRAKSYKLKTKSAVKKRFKVNCNGLVKRAQAGKRHIATKKTRDRIRRLGKPVFVQGKIRKNILTMLNKM